MPFQSSRVRQAMEKAGFHMESLAAAINAETGGNISRITVSAWLSGKCKPGDKNLDALCVVTGKDYNYFFAPEESQSPTIKKKVQSPTSKTRKRKAA